MWTCDRQLSNGLQKIKYSSVAQDKYLQRAIHYTITMHSPLYFVILIIKTFKVSYHHKTTKDTQYCYVRQRGLISSFLSTVANI